MAEWLEQLEKQISTAYTYYWQMDFHLPIEESYKLYTYMVKLYIQTFPAGNAMDDLSNVDI